jgi:hypothetical protein
MLTFGAPDRLVQATSSHGGMEEKGTGPSTMWIAIRCVATGSSTPRAMPGSLHRLEIPAHLDSLALRDCE